MSLFNGKGGTSGPLEVGDVVWYFTPYTSSVSKRVRKVDSLTGKGHYVYERQPPSGGYWSPGGKVVAVLGSTYRVAVTGLWDSQKHCFIAEEREFIRAHLDFKGTRNVA